MALAPGTRIGSYEIVGSVGAGGMGEVYRAFDSALGREVAIKVLPQSLAAEPDRIARFEREARTLAALNHANIARIYGLEKSGDRTAIVMELVEGQTLAERIAAGPIPVDESIGIAMQIVNALEAAHGKQIVHRDLKPANIVLRADGTVAVLDFGIAKAFEPQPAPDGSDRAVLTTPATQTGVILGTAAYMSPEQARGKFIDQRSDIWAFGCVLYEMLTGQSAFGSEDVPTTLARVLAQDTNMGSLPAMISPAVRQTLRLCLRKDPQQRVADIRDVRLALRGEFETAAPIGNAAGGRSRLRAAVGAVAAVLLAAAFGLGGWWLRPEAPQELIRSLITDPAAPFVPTEYDIDLAISADGSRVAFRSWSNGAPDLRLRSLSNLESISLGELSEVVRCLFFSPDGHWVGFYSGSSISRVSVDGGPPISIVSSLQGGSRGATWGSDDTIVFATTMTPGLQRVPVGGGEVELLTSPDSANGEVHWWPDLLPDGKAVLFTIDSASDETDAGRIAVVRIGESVPKVLIPVGSNPRYVASGHIVYSVGSTLLAVGFDPGRIEVTTDPIPIVDDVYVNPVGASSFAVSSTGALVYATGEIPVYLSDLVAVYRDGREERLQFSPDRYAWPRLSRDGNRVVVSIDNEDIWVGDVRRGVWNRVTTETGLDNVPMFTHDDRSIVYASLRGTPGMFSFVQQRADGTGEAEEILKAEGTGNFKPYVFTPDGTDTELLFDYGELAVLDIGIMTVGGNQEWRPLIATEAQEAAPSLSRDGQWIAYASNRSGECEIYAERFPDLTDRTKISIDGGAEPMWSPTRDELYYRQDDKLLAVPIDFASGFEPGDARIIAEGLPASNCGGRLYDLSADGEKFIFAKPIASAEGSARGLEQVLIQNWLLGIGQREPAR